MWQWYLIWSQVRKLLMIIAIGYNKKKFFRGLRIIRSRSWAPRHFWLLREYLHSARYEIFNYIHMATWPEVSNFRLQVGMFTCNNEISAFSNLTLYYQSTYRSSLRFMRFCLSKWKLHEKNLKILFNFFGIKRYIK